MSGIFLKFPRRLNEKFIFMLKIKLNVSQIKIIDHRDWLAKKNPFNWQKSQNWRYLFSMEFYNWYPFLIKLSNGQQLLVQFFLYREKSVFYFPAKSLLTSCLCFVNLLLVQLNQFIGTFRTCPFPGSVQQLQAEARRNFELK